MKIGLYLLAITALFASICTVANAQSNRDQALLDALVRKGVLTEKEATEISAETAQQVTDAQQQATIKVGDWVKELRLSGDLRIRNQFDQRTPMILTNPKLGAQDENIPRDRWRFRLRLSADFKLEGNFFGGVQLGTGDNRASDTKNATYTGGYDNYSIYITRAFMGWNPTPGLTFIAGKQPNPFYTTDLIYDPEIDPTGLVERIDFDKLFNLSFGEPVTADGKEGKAPVSPTAPAPGISLELALIAAQFIFENNNADSGNTQLKWDAYQFQQQLLARLHIGDKLTLTFAPGILADNDASVGATSVSSKGTLVSPTNTSFNGGQPLNNSAPFPITQRDLFILLAPGDITYKIFNRPLALYWDFAYNTEGNDRFNKDYGPLYSHYFYVGNSATPSFSDRVQPSLSDNLAWLVGIRYGANNKAGDFSISADYRQVGISSIDPNINSSNFALSNLNSEGFEFNAAYNFNDFLTGVLTLYYSEALTKNLYGGFATGNVPGATSTQQWPIARDRRDMVFQANLLMKF
jgi:polyhydroxyalkanoate synthesis regulator phasin